MLKEKKINLLQKLFKWISIILGNVAVSFMATGLYKLSIPTISKLIHISIEVLSSNYSLIIIFCSSSLVVSALLFFFKEKLRMRFKVYPELGQYVWNANIRTVLESPVFDDKKRLAKVKQNVDDYFKEAKGINLMLISGAERINDPFEDYILQKAEEYKDDENKIIKILLLSPHSKFIEQRAIDKKGAVPEEVRKYKENHMKSIQQIRLTYGTERVIFYDELPLWRLFRIGSRMFVSRYVEKRTAKESVTLGYVSPRAIPSNKNAPISPIIADNPYSSFDKYLEYLVAKYQYPFDKLKAEVKEKLISECFDMRMDACACFNCQNDIVNLIKKEVLKTKEEFKEEFNQLKEYMETILKSQGFEKYYLNARKTVFNNKRCKHLN